MVSHVAESIYPIHDDAELRDLALTQPYASALDDAVYHVNRYGEEGLFQGNDPADRPLTDNSVLLKEQFSGLVNVRNALVIAARIRKDTL
ncbi:MAG TPA: hypothetical protein PKV96_01255 [Candidatus Saccharimonas sp.]|nr:hypothetical protein [Candidatus Saccharimonas sp.]